VCSSVMSSHNDLECDINIILETINIVLHEDLESLRRIYTEGERVELWNRIISGYKKFVQNCLTKTSREIVDIVKHKYRFAMLMLAASFKLNGEKHNEIISMFKPEEYELLLDFEEFKIFDHLDIDAIVEAIKRHDERIYGFIKRYYEKQYHTLEIRWGPLMGDLVKAFEERYKERRKKIEEAAVAYVKRYGLIETMYEMEEAVRKVLEAGEFKKRLEEELKRKIDEYNVDMLKKKIVLLEEERESLFKVLERIENSVTITSAKAMTFAAELEKSRIEKERLLKMYEEVSYKLAVVEKELEEAKSKLEQKEEEFRKLMEKYHAYAGAAEALRAEAESLRNTVSKLSNEAEEYKRMLKTITEEKKFLEERFREVEAALRGESEGTLVTSEEALAIGESYIKRVKYKVTQPNAVITIYDPRHEKEVNIPKWDDEKDIILSGMDSPVKNRILILTKKRGILSRSPDILLEAIVKVHEESYASRGYDSKPVTLAEVVELMKDKSREAEEKDCYEILVIASPTGFTRKAIEYVFGEESYKTFISRNVTLYLVDLATGEVYMNKSDPAAIHNVHIVKPELSEETIKKIVDYVLSENAIVHAMRSSPAEPIVLVSSIAEGTGINDEAIILQALARLEKDGWGRKIYIKDEGIIAFKYSPQSMSKVMSKR